MIPRRRLFHLVAGFLSVCLTALIVAAPETKPQPVAEVTEVVLTMDKGALVITAKGNVPSGGWMGAMVMPVVYVVAPRDGIWDFTFTAIPPKGMSTQVITPIQASHTWDPLPRSIKGVRVHGAQGAVVKMIADAR